jgi:hypothetical protein
VTRHRLLGIIAFTISVAFSTPAFRWVIEQNMAWHMAFQIPLLCMSGWLLVNTETKNTLQPRLCVWLEKFYSYNQFGLTGFLLCTVVFSYWMLPLALDKAIVEPTSDLVKVLTLFIAGAVAKVSLQSAPIVVQLFFIGYWSSMLIGLGFYFSMTDLRLCNVYSLDSQVAAGQALIALGVCLGTAWVAKIFLPKRTLP